MMTTLHAVCDGVSVLFCAVLRCLNNSSPVGLC